MNFKIYQQINQLNISQKKMHYQLIIRNYEIVKVNEQLTLKINQIKG